MDSQQFDRFVQGLSRQLPRRSALAVLAGLTGVAVSGLAEVAGKRKHTNMKAQQRKARAQKDNNKANKTFCPEAQDAVTLQAKIDDPATTSLRLCGGTWLLDRTITISKDLTLLGTDATVLKMQDTDGDGYGDARVLAIAAGVAVTLQNLEITNGNATGFSAPLGNGGGIFNEGTLTLRGCQVRGNSAGYQGGGIYSFGGKLTLTAGSQVTGNTAKQDSYGGGIFSYVGTSVLRAGSSVTDNTAAQYGGGIYNHTSTLTLEADSSVTRNTAKYSGGGIQNNGGTVTIYDAGSVTDNTPAGDQCNPDIPITSPGSGICV